jgi:hypothetical protein
MDLLNALILFITLKTFKSVQLFVGILTLLEGGMASSLYDVAEWSPEEVCAWVASFRDLSQYVPSFQVCFFPTLLLHICIFIRTHRPTILMAPPCLHLMLKS